MRFSRNRILGLGAAAAVTAGSMLLATHYASAAEGSAGALPVTRSVTGATPELVARASCPDGMRVADVEATTDRAGAVVTAAFPGSTGPVAESGYDLAVARAGGPGGTTGEWTLTVTARCVAEADGVDVVPGRPVGDGVLEARCASGDSLVGSGFKEPGRLVRIDGGVRLEPGPGTDSSRAAVYAFCV